MEIKLDGVETVLQAFDDVLQGSTRTINKALKEGGLVLSRHTKTEIHSAANRGYATGELERSVYSTNPKKNKYGSFVVVKPAGTDSKGVRNGEKWGYLLNGNGRGSEPRDFKSKAIQASEKECVEITENALKELVKKLEV